MCWVLWTQLRPVLLMVPGYIFCAQDVTHLDFPMTGEVLSVLMDFVYNLRNCTCLNKGTGDVIAGHLASKTQSFDRCFLNEKMTSGRGFE